jgi:hypothetical protein
MRKDGTRFDARMYVSPLIDAKGQQTGWMTSMTNITEAKRIRDQLTASHERFTTVLEGLDASVSVLSVQQANCCSPTAPTAVVRRRCARPCAAGRLSRRALRGLFGARTDGDAVDVLSGLPPPS